MSCDNQRSRCITTCNRADFNNLSIKGVFERPKWHMGVSSPRLGLSPRSLPSPRSRSFVRGLALGILPALLMLCSGGGGGWAHWAARHAGVPPPGRAGGRVQLEASQPIGALAPHHQLVAQQLYGLAGDPGGIAYLDLLDDAVGMGWWALDGAVGVG